MNQHATLEVPTSGGTVEIVFPGSQPTTLTFDIPAPGGTIKINLTSNVVQPVRVDASTSRSSQQDTGSSRAAPMLFSSLPLPFEEPQVVKYTPIPTPEVKPRISSYVPRRFPSPEPDVHLEDPPAIPANLSNCGLVMYGYFIDATFCQERGFHDNDDASDQIGTCIDELRISAFAKLATFPGNNDIDLFYFALRDTGGPVRTVGNRGVPASKMKELEAKMGLKAACWISFDEVSQRPN